MTATSKTLPGKVGKPTNPFMQMIAAKKASEGATHSKAKAVRKPPKKSNCK